MRARALSPQLDLQIGSESLMLFRLSIVQITANGCCDFLGQCILVCINHCTCQCHDLFYSPKSSKIYRCWIVWGQNIRVVIIPSFLAIAFLGRSSYLHLISRYRFQVIASSYLARRSWSINICTRPICVCWLGEHAGFDKFHHVHGRECSGDGLDRFQDPKGVFGS